ncbi:amidohydrolase family protein [Pseudomonas aeruginosa]|uniref:amidohydrolase family protein n=1 Tax=Pseudomonas aeruginosa TaxID=287 RepID=UPI0010512562|nr:amidohydrolase family protein [Pseudomonas aeruginosa]
MAELYDGPIVDAHHHFWDPQANYHPWLAEDAKIPFRYGDYSAIKRRYLPADYFGDVGAHRVVETVYVETEWDPRDRGYAELARHGLHFDLQTPWWNLAEAACLARDFPDTLIVLNHAGLPSDRSEEGLAAWQRAMARFAECPNVALKISGIGQAGRRWSVEDNAWIVRESIALFGVERAMFASNFPVDSLCGSFDDIYGGFKRIVADLPYADQERLFHSNARRIYRTVPDTVRLQQASLDPRTSP